MALQQSLTRGDRVRQFGRPMTITPGTLMQKPIPARLVEPYLSGRRSVIAGFVYRALDSSFSKPADFYDVLDLGYVGSEFRANMTEIHVLRWRAADAASYLVPCSAAHGGDWAIRPPFTGSGYTSAAGRAIAEFFVDPVLLPVGAEMYRISRGRADIVASFDGQAWLRPADGR